MTSSMLNGVGVAMVGVWRQHTALDESDDAECSPEAPDRFRKMRSSSSLNSLRMSLRKRLPLRSVQTNSLPENPTWESLQAQPKTSAVRKLARSARSYMGGMYERLQRSKSSGQDECLVSTPGRTCEGEENGASFSGTPKRTPRRGGRRVATTTPRHTPRSKATPRRTPGSRRTPRAKDTPEADAGVRGVKTGKGRRQLVRMAALRSPYASPNTQNQRWKFDEDLDCVSSGLRKLQYQPQASDEAGRDNGTNSLEHYGGVMRRRLDPSGKWSRSNLACRASHLSNRLEGWAHTALNQIHKPR